MFLPIVERELRVAARRRTTYRYRMAFAVLASVVAAMLIVLGNVTSSREIGVRSFHTLATLGFFYCLLSGVRHAADALSEEKREGTLGLLFLTDLRGFDVVAGKLVSISARTLQGLLAFFPVLATTLLLGGTTGGEFWRATGVLTNTLFLALTAGLCISAFSREAHRALAGTVLLMAALCIAPAGIEYLNRAFKWFPSGWSVLGYASPASAIEAAIDMNFRSNPDRFWAALLANHLLAWTFLLAASWQTPRSWQQDGEVRPSRKRSRNSARFQSAEQALLWRSRLLDLNPVYWLAARDDRQRVLIAIFAGLALAATTFSLLLSHFLSGVTLGTATVFAMLFGLVLKLWVCWKATSTLAEARNSGAVELMLATPLTVGQIIQGNWQALQRFFLWPVVAALLVHLAPAIDQAFRSPLGQPIAYLFPFPAANLLGAATFILDLIALAWVGMWMGLRKPKAIQAFATTVLLALILPAVVLCLPNILFDLFWIIWARQKLERQFRKVAADQYAPPDRSPAAVPPRIGSALPAVRRG